MCRSKCKFYGKTDKNLKQKRQIKPFEIPGLARYFIEKKFSQPRRKDLTREGAILAALLLGEREQLPPDSTKEFQDAGLFHLFAISGAHIAIISYLLFRLFNLLGLKKRSSLFLLLPCLLFFGLFIPHRASVFRAVLMSILYLSGKIIWKDVNLLNTLGISAFFLVLVWPSNPFDICLLYTSPSPRD